jgi:CRISPR-associated protein Cmr6
MARCDTALLGAWRTRWQAIARAVGAEPFALWADWRLITGLGRHGPLEVGFRFDRYGFPILPGSGLKGLARTAALVEIAERVGGSPLGQVEKALVDAAVDLACLDRAERQRAATDAAWWQRALAAQRVAGADRAVGELAADFHAVFGTVGAAGGAVFLDAIPAEAPRLELDIMNPHYPQYYQSNGTTPPTDWQSPVPVYFLTVAPQTAFWFAVGWRGPEDSAGGARRRAEAWLRWGLMELGAGAKTSAGYGYFLDKPVQAERATAGSTGRQVPASGQPRGPVAASASPAPQRAAPAPPPQPALPRVTRRGTIVWIRPDRRRGCVRDDETGQEYRFGIEVVKGNTPANKSPVEFDLEGDRVVRVQRV